MRFASVLLLPVLFLLPAVAVGRLAFAEETATTAADVTERGRSLDRILDMALLPDGREIEGERALLFLIDPTPSLEGAELPAALGRALVRQAERLGSTEIAILPVGADAKPAWLAAERRRDAVGQIEAIVGRSSSAYVNVYADLRRAAGALKRRGGAHDLVLVTLENGDLEDNLEGTVKALAQADVRLVVVARQAFLLDTYGVGRTAGVPRGHELHGPEAAFIEMPWGWLFQQGRPNEGVASGFPVYGLSRVASASGGRVFLWYPPSASEHQCQHYGSCPFCTGDHLPEGTAYRAHRLKALAPVSASRKDAYEAAARDPRFRAILKAWDVLAKKGVVSGRPGVKRSGRTLQPVGAQVGRLAPIGFSAAFPSQARRAERLLDLVEDVRKELERDLAGVADDEGLPRYLALGDTTVVMLHLLRANLVAFLAYCRDVGPVMAGKRAESYELPEIPFYTGSERVIGIGWTNLSLCHGAKPFQELYLPGGDEMRGEIERLDQVLEPFFERYAHTPFAAYVRRSGVARFHLTVRGKYVPPPKRKVPGADTESTTTPTDRPSRGGPSTGTGSGPTTGGD